MSESVAAQQLVEVDDELLAHLFEAHEEGLLLPGQVVPAALQEVDLYVQFLVFGGLAVLLPHQRLEEGALRQLAAAGVLRLLRVVAAGTGLTVLLVQVGLDQLCFLILRERCGCAASLALHRLI